jgi:hypothetical protein
MSQAGLGWVRVEDDRDAAYPMSRAVPARVPATFRYWNSNRWWGDQGGTSTCVPYSFAHLLERPNTNTTPWRSMGGHVWSWSRQRHVFQGQSPLFDLDHGYAWMQRNDYWPGEDYDGTSVRAGAQYLQQQGLAKSYHWAYDAETVARAIMSVGPVVVGTLWTMDMFIADSKGFIRPSGAPAGGHAYLLDGVNVRHRFFRKKGSWGRQWAKNGHAFISFDDMDQLLKADGEACLVT